MSNEQFISEIRSHVNGLPVHKAKASRTKKLGRRGLAVFVVLVVATAVVSATVLTMYGGYRANLNSKVSIWVDGEKDGQIHDLDAVEMFGGDVLVTNHSFENKGGKTITVYKTEFINETIEGVPTPITQDEITVDYQTWTTSAGTIDMGTVGYMHGIRFDNQLDSQFQNTHAGCLIDNAFVIITDGDNLPYYRITYVRTDATPAHYSTWNSVGNCWNNNIALTINVRDSASGILVYDVGNMLNITVLYSKLPASFNWGYSATDNTGSPGQTLKFPVAWSGSDMDFANLQVDGAIYSELSFPVTLQPHQLLEYQTVYTVAPMIGENPYTVETIFTPN